jgi:hypothetical protein
VRRKAWATAENPENTVPKNQTTAAKKARAVQRAAGGKHTTLLRAAQTCGKDLDPFGVYPGTCAREPHSAWEPCSLDRDFDVQEWKQKAAAEQAAAETRWAALSTEERAEQERLAFEEAHDDGRTATDEWEDARSYKWED